jgi:predicted permease
VEPIVNVALPVFAVILCGYLAGRLGILGKASSEALNRYVYYFALPPLLFLAMARVPLHDILNVPFIAAYCGGMILAAAAACFGAYLLFHRRGVTLTFHGFTATYSNTGYMGIPLFIAAFGDTGVLPAIIATVINSSLVVACAVASAELAQSAGRRIGHVAADVCVALVTNPLVMAPLAGMAVSLSGLIIPRPVVALGELLGASASPGALFAIGLFLVGRSVASAPGELAWLSLFKLFFHPAATWLLTVVLFPMPAFWAHSAVLLAALPAGTLVFVIAQHYGVYAERISAAILVSTVLSVITVSILVARMPPP